MTTAREQYAEVLALIKDPGFPVCADGSRGCTAPGCVLVRRLRALAAALPDLEQAPQTWLYRCGNCGTQGALTELPPPIVADLTRGRTSTEREQTT